MRLGGLEMLELVVGHAGLLHGDGDLDRQIILPIGLTLH